MVVVAVTVDAANAYNDRIQTETAEQRSPVTISLVCPSDACCVTVCPLDTFCVRFHPLTFFLLHSTYLTLAVFLLFLKTLPCAWRYRVSAGTGWPGVSILWLGGMESWICNFYLSVAARKIV